MGVFLGCACGSDQNYVGRPDGTVVRARALVRVVPSKRWQPVRLARITNTPSTESTASIDQIEEGEAPHAAEPSPQDEPMSRDEPLGLRRVKITLANVKGVWFPPGCPKCNLYDIGQMQRAQGANHTEMCRRRVYDLLTREGVKKMTDAASQGRTTTKPSDEPKATPKGPSSSPASSHADALATDLLAHGKFASEDHQTEFEGMPDDVVADEIKDVLPPGPGIDVDSSLAQQEYTAVMDVLQTMGIDVVQACRFVDSIRKPPSRSFLDVCGQGRMLVAAHGRRRSLNLEGRCVLISKH